MLSSKGVDRTFKHNLLLAVFFAFVAGIINVFGLVKLGTFTTNITGHIGELAIAVEGNSSLSDLMKIVGWVVSFALGSFIASLCTNYFDGKRIKFSYILPILLEIILLLVSIYLHGSKDNKEEALELEILLLFIAMGLQNGIVSMVSGNVVRTTHLTGMVTDFGIGLGELIMRKGERKLKIRKIQLTLSIIISFALGGVVSAFLIFHFHQQVLWIPIALLAVLLFYDYKILGKSIHIIREKLHV